ncbi:transposase [Burkholderia territorii]|uniref:Transposase n=1 Tax=Burkholderia territorii TaxID=1503055 RepID=A0A108EPJ0_9BURK|nr:transposase [Burkholderia territorii]
MHAFHQKFGDGQRALAKAQILRIKRCIGERLLTQRLETQQREGVIIANLMNLWNSFGRPFVLRQPNYVCNQTGPIPS